MRSELRFRPKIGIEPKLTLKRGGGAMTGQKRRLRRQRLRQTAQGGVQLSEGAAGQIGAADGPLEERVTRKAEGRRNPFFHQDALTAGRVAGRWDEAGCFRMESSGFVEIGLVQAGLAGGVP